MGTDEVWTGWVSIEQNADRDPLKIRAWFFRKRGHAHEFLDEVNERVERIREEK